ncbi:MAG: IS1 family transposase, partial [Acidobacteriota bacterium]|nr:IS1 family transposase [Acidobacteriota bacterium]
MNELSIEQKTRLLNALVEGVGVRAAGRLVGVAKGTVLRLIREVGPACEAFMDRWITDLTCERLELDECWSFVHAKDKNLPKKLKKTEGYGSVWTWSGVCPDCKIIPAFTIGTRDSRTAVPFIVKLAKKYNGRRVQVTTDGFRPYFSSLLAAFEKGKLDLVEEVKRYKDQYAKQTPETRYSPGEILEWHKRVKVGDPDLDTATTSHIERVHLSYRMGMKRYTRLTNCFSRKLEYHRNAFAIWVFYYNFIRKHSALGRGKTPAMAAGIADHAFT